MADRNLEREVKLVVDDDFEPPDLADGPAGLARRSRRTAVHVDTYYDTDDLRLIRAGITLRSRQEDGATTWTVKLPMPDDEVAAGLTRLEVNVDAPAGRVPADASRLVRAHVRTGSLRRVARFRTTRTTTRLGRDGQAVAIIDDDVVEVEAGADAWRTVPGARGRAHPGGSQGPAPRTGRRAGRRRRRRGPSPSRR